MFKSLNFFYMFMFGFINTEEKTTHVHFPYFITVYKLDKYFFLVNMFSN